MDKFLPLSFGDKVSRKVHSGVQTGKYLGVGFQVNSVWVWWGGLPTLWDQKEIEELPKEYREVKPEVYERER